MTAPPAKVKAFLAKIKDDLLDVDDASTTTTPDQLLQGLLQLELLQRGMLVEGHIFDNVEAAAGMDLTETLPVLSAASSAMAGKIAEKLAEQQQQNNRKPSSHHDSSNKATASLQLLKRVNQDLRFQAILAKDPEYWIIAEGYFCRAALFQPDVPIHWKKAWDCLTARSSPSPPTNNLTPAAVPYLEQLIRIAQLNKNQSRVENLSLQLADCYLQPNDTDSTNAATTTNTTSIAAKAFLPKPPNPLSHTERLKAAETIVSTITNPESPYLTSLKLRLYHQQQQQPESSAYNPAVTIGELLWKQAPLEYSSLLVQHLDYLVAAGRNHGAWQHAVAFVTLVVQSNITSLSTPQVMEQVGLTVPIIEWCQPGSFSSEVLHRTRERLQDLLVYAQETAAKSMTKPSDVIKKIPCAINAIIAWLILRGDESTVGHGSLNSSLLSSLSPVLSGTNNNNNYAEQCGVTYLEFLVAWGGLDRIPWPHTFQAEARTIIQRARGVVTLVARPETALLLQMGEADAEGAAFDGGRLETARQLYENAIQKAETEASCSVLLMKLVMARCLIGLAQLDEKNENQLEVATVRIEKSMACLEGIEVDDRSDVHLWTRHGFLKSCVSFLTAQARQINASILLRRGQPNEAEAILEKAIEIAPNDPSASFGLGFFQLYKALFVGDNASSSGELKAAQVQLLKAAKLDSTRADPFALLGFWYEYHDDLKRAAGCYSKALLLNPAQPVAGRGLLRLAPASVLQATLDGAARMSSTTNGWAWRVIGENKAMKDGEDELAVVALLKALRCHDITRVKSDMQAPFYNNPKQLKKVTLSDQADTLWALARCYRRLGRFTASIRTFNSAIEIGCEAVPSELFRDCAQVELELGLLDEAERKYKLALDCAVGDGTVLLAYGRAMALLLMANRDHQDGKSGTAYKHLLVAIDSCTLISDRNFACVNKLLGDLYSYGREIPLDVFPHSDDGVENFYVKLDFIAKGETYYRQALALSRTDETRASLLTDIGSNILLRAQLSVYNELKGLWGNRNEETISLYSDAADAFRNAIDVIPDLAAAWCGLACSLVDADPLMAQHAFIRSLQLDKKAPDTYANLSFLYTKLKKFDGSTFVTDALTEVADTPTMWINRALVLEDRIGSVSAKQQAADAYRAALQVSKTPDALLGLAITLGHDSGSAESMLVLEEYIRLWGCSDAPAVALHGTKKIGFAISSALQYATEIAANGAETIKQRLSTFSPERVEDDHGNKLNVDKFLTLAQRVCEESDLYNPKETTDHLLSLQRLVINNPSDPNLWLQLTKSLIRFSALCDAAKTARRAVELFETKLKVTPCSASKVAEACGLEQWIHLVLDKEAHHVCLKKLQRSLIMDPSNRKARKALSLLCA